MAIRKAHCLFEQSGTFKKEFIKLGIPAEDYDIQNEFGETDNVIDLFSQIQGGYENKPSIFDNMAADDIVMAFFPCVRFENQILLAFRGEANQQRNHTEIQKLEYDLKIHQELSELYELITKLAHIAYKRNLKLIIENPYSTQHYLQRYWCLKPRIIDRDRTEKGDYYKKPTQYWFINCEPQFNFIFEVINYNALDYSIENVCRNKDGLAEKWRGSKTARSMIHPDYANRFIREYILEDK